MSRTMLFRGPEVLRPSPCCPCTVGVSMVLFSQRGAFEFEQWTIFLGIERFWESMLMAIGFGCYFGIEIILSDIHIGRPRSVHFRSAEPVGVVPWVPFLRLLHDLRMIKLATI